jgi:hypothetical protein
MSKYIVFLGILLLFFLTRINLEFPISLEEARESYTSYSLIEIGNDSNGGPPGLFFRADNNYLPTLPVYLRTIPIHFFGLGSLGVRIFGVFFGLLGVFVFYKLSRLLFSKAHSLTATLMLAASPFFVQLNIFNLGQTLSLVFFVVGLFFYFKKNTIFFLVFLLLSTLSSFWAIPACLIIGVYYLFKVKGAKVSLYFLMGLVVVLGIILATCPELGKYLLRESLVQDLKPASFTYEIDKRLSFGKIISSPLITEGFNFNRIAFNKVYFGITEFFKSLVKPFDYEYLTSSFQTQTILARERLDSVALPRIFFWEVPLILFGAILYLRSKDRKLIIIPMSIFASLLIFKDKALYLFIPVIVWLSALSLVYLVDNRKKILNKSILFVILLLLLGSYSDLISRLKDEKLDWIDPNSLSQYRIWNLLGDIDLSGKSVIVTDRLGEPAFYYLYYNKIEPEYFQKNKTLSHVPVNGTIRILKVGAVEFRSFKYSEEAKSKDKIWVGLPGEFLGEKESFKEIKGVPGGQIVDRVPAVRQTNKLFGDEVWIVKTPE